MFTKKTYRTRWPELLVAASTPRDSDRAGVDEDGQTETEYYPNAPMFVLNEHSFWSNEDSSVVQEGEVKSIYMTMTIPSYGIWWPVTHFYLDQKKRRDDDQVICDVNQIVCEVGPGPGTVWIDED